MSYVWEKNYSTGNYIARVSETRRVIRIGHSVPSPGGITFLYHAEEWGDYSLNYPITGPWERSPEKALKELDALLAPDLVPAHDRRHTI